MYRFSNGLVYTGATEKAVAYLMFQGNSDAIIWDSPLWEFKLEKPQGNRIYFSKYYGRLKIFKKPLPDHSLEKLLKTIDQLEVKEVHPCFIQGMENEALRIFPKLNPKVVSQYKSFIGYLNQKFDLHNWTRKDLEMKPFTYDLGPMMMGTLGERVFVLPEITKVYQAPSAWREINWYINNYFSGPYPNAEKLNTSYFNWSNLTLDKPYDSKEYEGLAYYLMANFIVIYEAWMDRPTADSLTLFIQLITQQNMRPWKDLFHHSIQTP